jgi:hypothetical protein
VDSVFLIHLSPLSVLHCPSGHSKGQPVGWPPLNSLVANDHGQTDIRRDL